MRKYRNLYQYNGQWYTKENRKAKAGELILVMKAISSHLHDNEVYKVMENKGLGLLLSNGYVIYNSQYQVLVPYIGAQKITDTCYDEMTSMEQQHNFIIQEHGAGKKAFMKWIEDNKNISQPVPFSKEYYTEPKKLTQAEYDKMKEQLMQEADKMDARYGGTYRSVYVAAIEHTLAELKKRIVPKKRKWTEAEIEEARRYVADKMYGLTKDRKFICFYKDSTKPTESIAVLYKKTTPSWGMVQNNDFKIVATYVKKAISKCMPTDEQNADIGKMVAVKKMFNESLPLWLKGKEK